MTIALREQRESRGLSVSELARRSGVERTHLYRLEAGENAPTLTTLTKLAKGLGVHPATLLIGRESR